MDRLRGIRLKRERAEKHIRDLDSAVLAFCSNAYVLGPEVKVDGAHIALHVESVKDIPPEFSTITTQASTKAIDFYYSMSIHVRD